jgi:hypothetical protein
MTTKTRREYFILLPLVLVLTGCGTDPPVPVGSNGGSAGTNGEQTATYDASKIPETADAAVRTVIEGIRQKHPEALWHFLPASYQQDVNDVVHEFARRMDPELWSKTVAVLDKLARVVKTQQELFTATIRGPGKGGDPGPPIDFEGLANLLQTLVKSDLGNLEKLKQADAGKILAVTGGQLLEQLQLLTKIGPQDSMSLPIDELSRLKIELKSSENDQAVVLIQSPGQAPQETEFVRVEGKWIPRDIAENWIETIGQAKARLALLSRENLVEMKPRWLTLVATFDQAFDQLAAARDKEQFAGARDGLILPIIALWGMLQQPAGADKPEPEPTETPTPSAAELATIVVRGKLDSATQDALLERLKSSLDQTEGAFAEFTGDDESTSFKIGPVVDLKAFAKRVDFLKVLEVDEKARTITATAKE